MATPKNERKPSKEAFDALYYQIHDDAVNMIEHNFRAKKEIADEKSGYISNASKKLMGVVWSLIHHIKVANSLYPTCREELIERRIEQDKALGDCFTILSLYDLVMYRLKVKGDLGVTEINHVSHEINAIKAWRTSDNKRFKDLK